MQRNKQQAIRKQNSIKVSSVLRLDLCVRGSHAGLLSGNTWSRIQTRFEDSIDKICNFFTKIKSKYRKHLIIWPKQASLNSNHIKTLKQKVDSFVRVNSKCKATSPASQQPARWGTGAEEGRPRAHTRRCTPAFRG